MLLLSLFLSLSPSPLIYVQFLMWFRLFNSCVGLLFFFKWLASNELIFIHYMRFYLNCILRRSFYSLALGCAATLVISTKRFKQMMMMMCPIEKKLKSMWITSTMGIMFVRVRPIIKCEAISKNKMCRLRKLIPRLWRHQIGSSISMLQHTLTHICISMVKREESKPATAHWLFRWLHYAADAAWKG